MARDGSTSVASPAARAASRRPARRCSDRRGMKPTTFAERLAHRCEKGVDMRGRRVAHERREVQTRRRVAHRTRDDQHRIASKTWEDADGALRVEVVLKRGGVGCPALERASGDQDPLDLGVAIRRPRCAFEEVGGGFGAAERVGQGRTQVRGISQPTRERRPVNSRSVATPSQVGQRAITGSERSGARHGSAGKGGRSCSCAFRAPGAGSARYSAVRDSTLNR